MIIEKSIISKRIVGFIVFLLVIVVIAHVLYEFKDYYSYADKTVTKNKNVEHNNDTITVIFIGDSWAAYHSQYDQHLKSCIETKINRPTKIISKGTVGAKTKTIYNKMHDCSPSGTKDLIKQSPNYAIVSAGINDAVAKMGTENYCYHYNLIIKELLSAGIKPIIIDMPQVDYKAIYQRESIIAQIRHRISSWLTGAPLWSFEDYRIALQSLLNRNELGKQLIFIPVSEWNLDGYKDFRMLYKEDHVHLNEKGYYLLDSCITTKIHSDI